MPTDVDLPTFEIMDGDKQDQAVQANVAMLGDTWSPTPAGGEKKIGPIDGGNIDDLQHEFVKAGTALTDRAENLKGFSQSEKEFVKKAQDLLVDGKLDELKQALAKEFKDSPEGMEKMVKGLNETLKGTGLSAEMLPNVEGQSSPRMQIAVDRPPSQMKLTIDPSSPNSFQPEDGKAIAAHLKSGIEDISSLQFLRPPRFGHPGRWDEIHHMDG